MRIYLECKTVAVVCYGPMTMLEVELLGGPFSRSGKLTLKLADPTREQRHAFTPGEMYEIDVPDMPEKLDEAP